MYNNLDLTICTPYSLYLHIPFCLHRCSYCDFNTYAGLDHLIPAYVDALLVEAAYVCQSADSRLRVHTLYLGGGTPSLLPAMQIQRFVDGLSQYFELDANMEFTLEANPGTLNPGYLQALHACGVNRLSLGVQSAHPEELYLLERQHDVYDVIQAVKWARQAGFNNLSLDLIYGLPGQGLAAWKRTLDFAANLHPEHLSLYALSLEKGTPLQTWVARGLLIPPDDDMAADMYEFASSRLTSAGFEQYEISNWGKMDPVLGVRSSVHNLQYWRSLPYLGLGAGAHGYADRTRVANLRHPVAYIQKMAEAHAPLPFPRTPATQEFHLNDLQEDIAETMMMGLRLVKEGVSRRQFKALFGSELIEVFPEQINRLVAQGLLEWAEQEDILRLTSNGRLLGNRVFLEFL